jgi:hypothetical protein
MRFLDEMRGYANDEEWNMIKAEIKELFEMSSSYEGIEEIITKQDFKVLFEFISGDISRDDVWFLGLLNEKKS